MAKCYKKHPSIGFKCSEGLTQIARYCSEVSPYSGLILARSTLQRNPNKLALWKLCGLKLGPMSKHSMIYSLNSQLQPQSTKKPGKFTLKETARIQAPSMLNKTRLLTSCPILRQQPILKNYTYDHNQSRIIKHPHYYPYLIMDPLQHQYKYEWFKELKFWFWGDLECRSYAFLRGKILDPSYKNHFFFL